MIFSVGKLLGDPDPYVITYESNSVGNIYEIFNKWYC